jgi:hypothetical protein
MESLSKFSKFMFKTANQICTLRDLLAAGNFTGVLEMIESVGSAAHAKIEVTDDFPSILSNEVQLSLSAHVDIEVQKYLNRCITKILINIRVYFCVGLYRLKLSKSLPGQSMPYSGSFV